MKHFTIKIILLGLLAAVISQGCFTTSKTQKGAAIGGGMGATVGALIGKTAGNTALGTIIGSAIGGTAGAYIGKKMDQVTGIDQTILFDAGSSELSASAQSSLKSLATSLQNNPKVTVLITGHTDSLGTPGYNMELSVKRAESVKNYLAAAGISDKRMVTRGKGATENKADNSTREGREKNRRVEVVADLEKK